MRKDADFLVLDTITLSVLNNENIANIIKNNLEEIKENTLTTSVVFTEIEGVSKEWDINGETVLFTIAK